MRRPPRPRFILIGNPENRRTALFQGALERWDLPLATVWSYRELLLNGGDLPKAPASGQVVRIDSPGEDFGVEQGLLCLGAEAAAAEGSPHLEPEQVRRLEFDRGLILHPRQWYLGYRRLLTRIGAQLASIPGTVVLNHPDDIAVMFDKKVCHALCRSAGIPTPLDLGPVESCEELLWRMREKGVRRAFVKPAHGSSASGVVAFSWVHGRQLAVTSVEIVASGGSSRLYNSLKVRSYRQPEIIAGLLDLLCRERVHVEEWLPKATLGHGCFDLRIVTIGGEPLHTVVRESRSPMTNLHLGNRRGDVRSLLSRLGEERWHDLEETCRRTASLFPRTLSTGLDLCLAPGWRRHAVLEVNAFGDLLPGVLHNGLDTYSAQIRAIRDLDMATGFAPTFPLQ